MDKIFVLTDIHFGIDKKSITHPEYFRQNNSQALKEINNLLKYIPSNINLYLQLGDLIRSIENQEVDQKHLIKTKNILKLYFPKIYNITGNHDQALQNQSLDQSIINLNLKNCQALIIDPQNKQQLSIDEINKVKSLISKSKKKTILIFTHIPIFPISSKDNFYFYNKISDQYFKNYQEIFNNLNYKSKIFVISGHYHWISSTEINSKIRQITLPSFSENIITTPKCDIHPCVYNLIEINKKILTIKSYSRQFCFSNLEFSISH